MLRAKQIPVTAEMLYGIRDELMHRFTSVDLNFQSLEKKIDGRFELMMAEMRRIGVVTEEQRAQNIYALDAVTNVSDRVQKIEGRLGKLEEDWQLHKPLIKR